MKAVLISIQPKWVAKITSGQKTIEVRKTRPKIETPFKCYIYETQAFTETPWVDEDGHYIFKGRGQVIGEFVCDRINEYGAYCYGWYRYSMKETCLWADEMARYGQGKPLYGWHISDLKIYYKPKDLSEFSKYGFNRFVPWGRPPQSWGYVDEVNYGRYNKGE